jgi:hypothetical protein
LLDTTFYINTDEKKALRESFKVFDKNGDGRICAKELREALISIGEKLSSEDIEELMKKDAACLAEKQHIPIYSISFHPTVERIHDLQNSR